MLSNMTRGVSSPNGQMRALGSCAGIVAGLQSKYFLAFRELCLLAQLHIGQNPNTRPASRNLLGVSSSEASTTASSSNKATFTNSPVASAQLCTQWKHPNLLSTPQLGRYYSGRSFPAELLASAGPLSGYQSVDSASSQSSPKALTSSIPILQTAPGIEHFTNPKSQRRWMSPLAGSATMYPEIEEAPHSSVAVPHPFPHSHSTIQAGRQRHEEWPSAEYLREARAAIFQKEAFIIDMDGVVYRGSRLLPGVREFVQWLLDENKRFLFLTNSSDKTREELQQKLARMGVDVETEHFYTAALATAAFLSSQRPNGSAYVIGDPGVMSALYSVGYSMNDVNPDYVVVGETRNYKDWSTYLADLGTRTLERKARYLIIYERLEHAVHLVLNGSKLIGTNCDKTDPSPDHPGEVIPAAGSIIKPIESATGLQAYFVGKPNPLMMRSALATLGASRRSTIIIGDRMDTDILGGLEVTRVRGKYISAGKQNLQASIDSALVLSGVTSVPEMRRFAYMPRFVLRGLVDLVPDGVPMSAVDHE